MTDVRRDLVEWLQSQKDWLQLAAQGLLEAASPDAVEVQPIVDHLKTAGGQEVTSHRSFDGLSGKSGTDKELRIREIGEIFGIENLNPRKPLDFGEGNLAVVYGHNGSGKSGYVRTIKRASGHSRAPHLYANVFGTPPDRRQCTIAYEIGGDQTHTQWPANGPAVEALKAVDVFDADTARLYLTQENAVTYTPPQIEFVEELANLCDRIGRTLRKEQDDLVNRLPKLPEKYSSSPTATKLKSLTADSTQETVTTLTSWSNDDQYALDRLADRLKTADPSALALKKRKEKDQASQLARQLEEAVNAVGREQLETIRSLQNDATRKRQTAMEAGEIESAHLDGIGTETWKALWRAARQYSQTAYPGQSFPVGHEGARCLLCHQVLAPDARDRLNDFETYVQGTLEKEATAAEEAHRKALAALPKALSREDIQTRCGAAGITDDSLIDSLAMVWEGIRDLVERVKAGSDDYEEFAIPLPQDLLAQLAGYEQEQDELAQQYESDAKDFDRNAAEKSRLDLEARKWTSQQAEAIADEIERLKEIKRYEHWKALANSGPISRKAASLAETVITQAYVDRFNDELRRLGAQNLRVHLTKTRTKVGSILHQIKLTGAQTEYDSPDSVLSDGERRIVALAAFLADVGDKPHVAPFLFDDPISSLDLEFEAFVAKRFAELARERQVIVFTHRLSLYGSMEDAAKKIGDSWKDNNLVQRCVESFGGSAGHPADDSIVATNTKKANNALLRRLDAAKEYADQGDPETYRILAQGICTDFRRLLERTVEDDLLHAVVKRHRRSVTTEGRLMSLPRIDPSDCEFIDNLMTKYSAFEHSQSSETPVRIPEEQELREDVEGLKSWRERFKSRG